jgi:hypothetical protein
MACVPAPTRCVGTVIDTTSCAARATPVSSAAVRNITVLDRPGAASTCHRAGDLAVLVLWYVRNLRFGACTLRYKTQITSDPVGLAAHPTDMRQFIVSTEAGAATGALQSLSETAQDHA